MTCRVASLCVTLVFAWLAPAALGTEDPLEAKAQLFRQAILERHLSPEGLLLYRINLETDSLEMGDRRFDTILMTAVI